MNETYSDSEAKENETLSVVEALRLQDSADVAIEELELQIKSLAEGVHDFKVERTEVFKNWVAEVRNAGHIISKPGHFEPTESVDPRQIISTINHRINKPCSFVSSAFMYGNLSLLASCKEQYSEELPSENSSKIITRHLERALDGIKLGTYITKSFLLMSKIYDVNVSETGATLAGYKHLGFSSTLLPSESEITNSSVLNPLWVAAVEEIIWNAEKYGADAVCVWKENGYYCFGNNGTPLSPDEAVEVNEGGVRLYKEIEGTGEGINLIRNMGFDYIIRPATETERTTYGVNTVVQIRPVEEISSIAELDKQTGTALESSPQEVAQSP